MADDAVILFIEAQPRRRGAARQRLAELHCKQAVISATHNIKVIRGKECI
jgi:hypothetical protein